MVCGCGWGGVGWGGVGDEEQRSVRARSVDGRHTGIGLFIAAEGHVLSGLRVYD